MCFDPVSATLTAASTALGVGGQLMAGRSTARAARMTAWQAQRRAEAARENAITARAAGAFEESRVRDRTDAVLGGQLASVTARDLDPAYGSPLVAAGLSAIQGEADALLTRASGQSRAAGLMQEATASLWQGADALGRGQDAQLGALIGAGTTILSAIKPWAGLIGGSGGGGSGGGFSAAPAAIGGGSSIYSSTGGRW